MIKESTKSLIRNYIKLTREQAERYWERVENIIKEALAREQFYRQNGLPIEVNTIIENEVWQLTVIPNKEANLLYDTTIIQTQQLREELIRTTKSNTKAFIDTMIWLIRLLRNEKPITDYPPKDSILAAEIWKGIIKTERRAIENEEDILKGERDLEKARKGERDLEKARKGERDLEKARKGERDFKQKVEKHQRELQQKKQALDQAWEKRKLELEREEKEREAERARLREQKITENKNDEEEKAKERRKARLDQIAKEKNKLVDNLKEAKEYAKDAYDWLPPKARYWVKIGICVIVIIAAIWGFKYIVRFSKWVFRFLKWIWNNIVEATREIKSLFSKEKKGEKAKPTEEKNNSEKFSDSSIAENKESKKLEEQRNKKDRRKNRRKSNKKKVKGDSS